MQEELRSTLTSAVLSNVEKFHVDSVLSERQHNQLNFFVDRWQSLLERSTPISVREGQTLFYQGHNPCGVYVITSGQLVLKCDVDQQSLVKNVLFQPLGLDLLINEKVYPYSGIAKTPLEGFFISKKHLTDMGFFG